jgi:hypothetical protein
MSDPSEQIAPQPFAITLDQKASRALYIFLPGRFINFPKRKPRHLRQIMMNEVIVVVQNQFRVVESYAGRGSMACHRVRSLNFTRILPARCSRCSGHRLA